MIGEGGRTRVSAGMPLCVVGASPSVVARQPSDQLRVSSHVEGEPRPPLTSIRD